MEQCRHRLLVRCKRITNPISNPKIHRHYQMTNRDETLVSPVKGHVWKSSFSNIATMNVEAKASSSMIASSNVGDLLMSAHAFSEGRRYVLKTPTSEKVGITGLAILTKSLLWEEWYQKLSELFVASQNNARKTEKNCPPFLLSQAFKISL